MALKDQLASPPWGAYLNDSWSAGSKKPSSLALHLSLWGKLKPVFSGTPHGITPLVPSFLCVCPGKISLANHSHLILTSGSASGHPTKDRYRDDHISSSLPLICSWFNLTSWCFNKTTFQQSVHVYLEFLINYENSMYLWHRIFSGHLGDG